MNLFIIDKIIAACDKHLQMCSLANERIAVTRIRQYAAALNADGRVLVSLSLDDLHPEISKLYAAMSEV